MAAVQLNFTIRTSANCKAVHLIGSWDKYNGKLPLSKDTAKASSWKGAFRFQSATLKQGQRYWYYYIIDGYHVSHDPARPHVVEPTTGRKLNILDIPVAKSSATAKSASSKESRRISRNSIKEGVRGRGPNPEDIEMPRPQRQHALARSEYNCPTVEALAAKFAAQQFEDDDSEESDSGGSDDESDVPSLSSRSSNSSTPSSVSSLSSLCTCERYGITRTGSRVKLDCGGSRCGDSCDSESCASESDGEYRRHISTRRHGMVVRK